MSHITTDLDSLSRLARLDLSPEQRAAFSEQIPRIVDYVGQLQSVDLETTPADRERPWTWRPDTISPSRTTDLLLKAAPDRQENFWKVKSVFDHAAN